MNETDETDERNESGQFFHEFFHGRMSTATSKRQCRRTVAFDEEAMKGIAAEAIEKMGVDVDGNEAAEQIHICLMAGRMAALGA